MISEIKALIKQANNTTVIGDLIDINMKISGFLIWAAESENKLLEKKLSAYNDRKLFQARAALESGDGITKAEKQATVYSKKYMDNELKTEVEYQAARSFRSQVNEFTQALTQKIAFLRRESELTSRHQ